MTISNKLANIPDSYFGKTMGRKVEHGPLPLIIWQLVSRMAKRLKALLITLLMLFEFLKIKNMVHFMVRNPKEAIVNFYQRQYGVELHKDDEVCILYGTKMV